MRQRDIKEGMKVVVKKVKGVSDDWDESENKLEGKVVTVTDIADDEIYVKRGKTIGLFFPRELQKVEE